MVISDWLLETMVTSDWSLGTMMIGSDWMLKNNGDQWLDAEWLVIGNYVDD